MGEGDRGVYSARRPAFDHHRGLSQTEDPLSAFKAPDARTARLFVRGAASCSFRAWAEPLGSGWACGLGPFPLSAGAEPVPFREPPSSSIGEEDAACSAGVLLRLAGVPMPAARAVEGSGGWRWAQANLPAPASEAQPDGEGLAALSGAEACLMAAAPDFVTGVEGESRLAPAAPRRALAPDPAMAAWLACGASLFGARAMAEAAPAESEAAARWAREARLPLLFVGGEAAEPMGPARLAELTGDAVRDSEVVSMPGRISDGGALDCLQSAPTPVFPGPAGQRPPEAPLRWSPPPAGARPFPWEASAVSVGSFLEADAGHFETALAAAASAAFLRPADLAVFSASDRRRALAVPQAWGLGEGAASVAAGARLFDPKRKCAAVVPAPRGMALGWLIHLASRNADLTVIAEGAGPAALAALASAGLSFHARLRLSDGEAAAAALEAALRHRGLAFVELSEAAPTAVLNDHPRAPAWEESPA